MNETFEKLVDFGKKATGLSRRVIGKSLSGSLPEAKKTPIGKLIVKGRLEELKKRFAERQGFIDSLTKLHNRRFFDDALDREIARAKRDEMPLALMFIDGDNFKFINDTFGHQEGDRFLIRLAKFLSEKLRNSDIICRFGGDEIAVIMTETYLEGKEEGESLNTRMNELKNQWLEENGLFVNNQPVVNVAESQGTLSMGIAFFEPQMTAANFLRAADSAAYEAKQSKNTVVIKETTVIAP